MQHANVLEQYKMQSLETLTSGEVVVKLLEEASKQLSISIFLINRDNIAKSYDCVSKAQRIISTLNHSLDMNYAISIELRDMYNFMFGSLSKAIVEKDTGLIKDILSLVDDLKNTFKQADKLARSGKQHG
ncbi:MAG: flagellar protein FliS [Clostridiales bacterium]|jgi:flagellar protein FliS|nr:flagellar protein FliS [Clostridiales bacterium]